MRRFVNILLILVVLGALVFLGIKAKLIPNPMEGRVPDPAPSPALTSRGELRLAAADRPERLLLASLERLMKVENQNIKLVEYNPETVWMELANGELDLVIAPIGEAVKAQGRFQAGQFLFFTGTSTGLDQLLASQKVAKPKSVAIQTAAATEFLAQKMLPEASTVPASSLQEAESWLKGGAVDAALINTSASTPNLQDSFRVLAQTSSKDAMPTVAVLSRAFSENADKPEFESRREVLVAALESWSGLVGYLKTQPELLKTTLRKEAEESQINVDILLKDYRFLDPSTGRSQLLEFHQQGQLKKTLDLLVLAGVPNLSAPDWNSVVDLPAILQQALRGLEANVETPATTPSPESTPTPVASPPQPTPTPETSPEQAVVTPTPSPSPEATQTALDTASYNYPKVDVPKSWPEPLLQQSASKAATLAPAISGKQVALASSDYIQIYNWKGQPVKVPLDGEPTTEPLTDGRAFYIAQEGKIFATNGKGKSLWEVEVKGKPFVCPDIIEERLVYSIDEGDRGRLLCLDPLDGEILWQQVLDSPPTSAPVVVTHNNVSLTLVLDKKALLRAWSLEKGNLLWSRDLKKTSYIPLAAGFGSVAICQPEGQVRLLSLDTGEQIWDANMATPLASPPTLFSKGVLVPAKDTYLYALDKKTGAISWKLTLSSTLSQPAVVAGDKILQSDEDGSVHAVDPRSGQLLDKVSVGKGWVSRPVFYGKRWALVDGAGVFRVYERP